MNDDSLVGQRLAARWGLTGEQISQLARVLGALETDTRAPTSVRAAEQAVNVHLADSLASLDIEAIRTAASIADLGTGAGFPGVALAIALPGAEIRLIESQRRRCQFLERLCAAAEIENVRVIWARVEEWREGLSANDAVVARALAPQSVVLEYAAPLLRLGGTLVDWRGRRVSEDEQAAQSAARELGLRLSEIRRVEPFEGARDRHLHVYLKVGDTPEGFPRRAGMARKRPLGSPASRSR
jgi:16S rRNA (guanine527-N7)-methyltransferase